MPKSKVDAKKRTAQNSRTKRNITARRKAHAKNHPNDVDHKKMVPIKWHSGSSMIKPVDFEEKAVKGSLSRAKRWV